MTAYLIGRMAITDPDTYAQYKVHTPAIVEKYGGRFLARGGPRVTVEGAEDERRIVVVEFPSTENARQFYYSAEYQAAKAIRKDAAEAVELVIVEGFEPAIPAASPAARAHAS
jgi:uncharacterized protein (DUF1330 family)